MAGGYKKVITYDTFQALIKFSSFLPLLGVQQGGLQVCNACAGQGRAKDNG
jgi:hypothetical protein